MEKIGMKPKQREKNKIKQGFKIMQMHTVGSCTLA